MYFSIALISGLMYLKVPATVEINVEDSIERATPKSPSFKCSSKDKNIFLFGNIKYRFIGNDFSHLLTLV